MRQKYLLSIVFYLLAWSAQASESSTISPATSYTPLRGTQCLQPSQARAWTYVDDHHILVDGGRYKYRVELSSRCSALSYTSHILLRGDPVTRQVCGGLNNAVLTRDYPCRISQMTLLSKEEYKQALKEAAAARKAAKEAKKAAKAEAKSKSTTP